VTRPPHVLVFQDVFTATPDYHALADVELTVFSDPAIHARLDLPDSARRIEFDTPRRNLAVAADALRAAHAERPIDRIFGFSEECQYMLAALREELGIPGPSRSEIALYRNKILMKRALQARGVRVPAFAAVPTDAASRRPLDPPAPYPLIVKPIDQTSATDVRSVSDASELREALARYAEIGYDWADVEQQIFGPMYHADFVRVDGRLAFLALGTYGQEALWTTQTDSYSLQVPPDEEEHRSARRFVDDALAALPLRSVCGHMEIFRAGEEWVFCETCARLGGGRIQDALDVSYGVHLPTVMSRLYAGLRPRLDGAEWQRASAYVFVFSTVAGQVVELEELVLESEVVELSGLVFHVEPTWRIKRGAPILSVVAAHDSYDVLCEWLASREVETERWREAVVVDVDASGDEEPDWLRAGMPRAAPDPFAVPVA
jgi:biotin carboxylase